MSMEGMPTNTSEATNETTEIVALENEAKIELIKKEIGNLYTELQDMNARKAEHVEETETYMGAQGYTAQNESEANSAEFYTKQIQKELFADKQKGLAYLSKLLEVSVDEPEPYRRNLQSLIEDFDARKVLYEQGTDSVGAGVWNLINKYAAKLPHAQIASLVENGAIVKNRRIALQEKIDSDEGLKEITERHQNYNKVNAVTEREIEIRGRLTALKEEAKELGHTDLL